MWLRCHWSPLGSLSSASSWYSHCKLWWCSYRPISFVALCINFNLSLTPPLLLCMGMLRPQVRWHGKWSSAILPFPGIVFPYASAGFTGHYKSVKCHSWGFVPAPVISCKAHRYQNQNKGVSFFQGNSSVTVSSCSIISSHWTKTQVFLVNPFYGKILLSLLSLHQWWQISLW